MKRKTEVYSIRGFLRNEKPIRVEGGISPAVISIAFATGLTVASVVYTTVTMDTIPFDHNAVMAATTSDGVGVSKEFDRDIWPIFIDIGKPIAKTMMALGIYQVMRNNDRGWKTMQRAGLGLVCLYMIDVGINLLTGVGQNMQHNIVVNG